MLMKMDRSIKLVKVDWELTAKTFGGHKLTPSGQVKLIVNLNADTGPVNMVDSVDCLVIEDD
ncbi:hypothetical protein PR003_g16401 [Phytophthora rubi]|uniref:Uncharacterized protein n=1 Tax=Phytophthora rubi TaxID=129364 RepID=A0A6A4ENM9_9STRA|nr:hypothetical protein PR002_g15510 [Phytophthora rubi]KAE9325765.1 hypothetical protein PR003_g16401 [Phytophthora rubi]